MYAANGGDEAEARRDPENEPCDTVEGDRHRKPTILITTSFSPSRKPSIGRAFWAGICVSAAQKLG
jgi:hypothetical protein